MVPSMTFIGMNQDFLSADQVLKLRSPESGPAEQFENISPRRTDS